MKSLILKIVLPLTIIFFSVFTKWWYVLPEDGPHTMMSGFPMIWISEGWHTSMSYQFFLMEFSINLLTYFLSTLVITWLINKHVVTIVVPKYVSALLLSLAGFTCAIAIWIGSMPIHIYKAHRDVDIEVLKTGYKFLWQHPETPNPENYKPKTEDKRTHNNVYDS